MEQGELTRSERESWIGFRRPRRREGREGGFEMEEEDEEERKRLGRNTDIVAKREVEMARAMTAAIFEEP